MRKIDRSKWSVSFKVRLKIFFKNSFIFTKFVTMEIKFNSKEESNRLQELAFLALTPTERVLHFFKLSQQINLFPTASPKKDNSNFIIEIYKSNDRELG